MSEMVHYKLGPNTEVLFQNAN